MLAEWAVGLHSLATGGADDHRGVTYTPPVVALAIGAFVVGEPVRLLDFMAMAAILVGTTLLQAGRWT